MDIDWSALTGFEWDSGNETKSATKHRVSCAEGEQVFAGVPLVVEDEKHSSGEPRWHALGESEEGRRLMVSFTIRGSMVRVISARSMHKKEQQVYEQQK